MYISINRQLQRKGRTRRRYADNIKTDNIVISCVDGDWFELLQERLKGKYRVEYIKRSLDHMNTCRFAEKTPYLENNSSSLLLLLLLLLLCITDDTVPLIVPDTCKERSIIFT
jgi:hypothetical protein